MSHCDVTWAKTWKKIRDPPPPSSSDFHPRFFIEGGGGLNHKSSTKTYVANEKNVWKIRRTFFKNLSENFNFFQLKWIFLIFRMLCHSTYLIFGKIDYLDRLFLVKSVNGYFFFFWKSTAPFFIQKPYNINRIWHPLYSSTYAATLQNFIGKLRLERA